MVTLALPMSAADLPVRESGQNDTTVLLPWCSHGCSWNLKMDFSFDWPRSGRVVITPFNRLVSVMMPALLLSTLDLPLDAFKRRFFA
ncbi:hypothetical protein BaRGS_00016399 [Batillaria attramentaria]|uniref:Uncharacterized protein n=1 Tax=Batillaria attramentaria TaxID=370345 RepID=A0ABD0KYL0_9CAEN